MNLCKLRGYLIYVVQVARQSQAWINFIWWNRRVGVRRLRHVQLHSHYFGVGGWQRLRRIVET